MKLFKQRWRDMSLGAKIISLMSVLVLIGTLTLTALSVQRERSNFQRELEQQSELVMDVIVLSVKDPLYYQQLDELRFIANEVTANPDVTLLVFYDAHGRVLIDALNPGLTYAQKVDPLGQRLVQLTSETGFRDWQDGQLLAGRQVRLGNSTIGAVALGLSTQPLDQKILDITRQNLWLALAAMLIGATFSVIMVRQITNPLRDLTHVALEMMNGNTAIRATALGHDEVGQVSEAFNKMAVSIQERETSLRNFAAELEITVAERTAKLRQQAAQLEKLAISDPLTRIFNRRHFFELAEVEMERAVRYRYPLSLLLFDADHFKSINDTYGHPFGDQILIGLVHLCEQNIRTVDIFARYGGEEFILLMPQTECDAALKIAERLRAVVENSPQTFKGKTVHLTISVGLACWQPGEKITLAELVQQADEALYLSKQSGRNRVTRFHPPQS